MDKLATELLEEIFSQIDSPRDLLNLAIAYGRPSLTSQIIPRHTEYRDLRADMTTPEVWAHLARRPDLTKNIRSIHGAHSPILGTTHGGQPFTLMDEHDCNARKQRREETIKNMTLALRSMTHLKIFLCAFPANPSILRELSRMATLEQLNGFILSPGRPPTNIQHVVLDWNLPKLKDLQVKSFRNTDIPNLPMSQLLRQSGVSLQRLTISELCLNDVALDVHLPSLSYLKITHDGHLVNPPPNLVQNIVTFLARHSSINDLAWNRKYGQITFPRHVLPNLKMLRASTKVLRALDRSHNPSLDEASENPAGHTLVLSKLDIEYLHAPISIAELNALCCLNRECLKRFCVDTEEPFAEVKRMGELFPSIQCLSFSCPPTFKLVIPLYLHDSFL
ncbi:hypothetical protein BDN72DRAFT_278309 [Pluteus cervinus]|uniref:Uncharacterized protein n=1 Tax=Pluteus cervinus TaxID=181527 RepID=A0ACD3AFF2_9AGAR|nr:hypothetical protein BDN72DRAFT_278309 [Pluteus cervinus]